MRLLMLLLAMASGTFDVATVKRSPPIKGDSYSITLGVFQHGRLEFGNANLSDCLKYAYRLVSDDQISGPDWIKSKVVLFDILAQTSPDTPRDELPEMMQALLKDRLGLAVHTEKKEMRYLILIQARTGSKMPIARADAVRNNSVGNGHVNGNQMPMLTLASMLSRMEHQIVVNQTGLKGEYEVKLQWSPDSGRPTVSADDAPAGVSLFTAVQEQLGLRLESRKGPLDVLVIDHAEQVPAEN